jgi:hypothetical protein
MIARITPLYTVILALQYKEQAEKHQEKETIQTGGFLLGS